MKGGGLRSHLWADLTRNKIAAAAQGGALVVIPVGATEQHAEHLPTGTDTHTASEIALRAARICAHPVLVAPAVSVAFSPHHGAWTGTLTLRLGTLQALLHDLKGSIARAGFQWQLLVNGHGCNRGAYSTALGHLFHAHVASHSMTFGHPRELLCEAVYSCRNFAAWVNSDGLCGFVQGVPTRPAERLSNSWLRRARGWALGQSQSMT